MSTPPLTPTLDKRRAVIDQSRQISEFLDWLSDQGIHLARYRKLEGWRDEILLPIPDGPAALLHQYFDIDPATEEAELLAVLDYIRGL